MRTNRLYTITIVMIWHAPALAGTMLAVRPGVMCASAEALSKLTLPDGSSRTAKSGARPAEIAEKQAGGCIDIPPGAKVEVVTARKNTSIVRFDAHDGRGDRVFIVPNVDFANAAATVGPDRSRHVPAWPDADFPPLVEAHRLFAAVHKHCPTMGWNDYLFSHTEVGPWDGITEKLTAAQRQAIDQEIGRQCDVGVSCPADITFGMEVQMGYLDALVAAICSTRAAGDGKSSKADPR